MLVIFNSDKWGQAEFPDSLLNLTSLFRGCDMTDVAAKFCVNNIYICCTDREHLNCVLKKGVCILYLSLAGTLHLNIFCG